MRRRCRADSTCNARLRSVSRLSRTWCLSPREHFTRRVAVNNNNNNNNIIIIIIIIIIISSSSNTVYNIRRNTVTTFAYVQNDDESLRGHCTNERRFRKRNKMWFKTRAENGEGWTTICSSEFCGTRTTPSTLCCHADRRPNLTYELRPRSHDRELAVKLSCLTESNFILRQLYKNSY